MTTIARSPSEMNRKDMETATKRALKRAIRKYESARHRLVAAKPTCMMRRFKTQAGEVQCVVRLVEPDDKRPYTVTTWKVKDEWRSVSRKEIERRMKDAA